MWKSTSSTQQHSSTIRPRRPPHSTTECNSSKAWKQHYSSTITSILITITRKCWKVPQDTNGTSQNIESTTGNQLWHQHYKSTPNYTMACTTCSLSTQQIRNTCRWQHKLLQKMMEQRTSNTTVWVWRNSPLPTTQREGPTKIGKQISPSNLAWKRHSNRRNSPWHSNKGCTFQDNQETTNAREVQQAVDGHHQQQRIEQISDSRYNSTITGGIQTSTENTEGFSSSSYTDNGRADDSTAATTSTSIANYGLTNGNSTDTSTSTSSITITEKNSTGWSCRRFIVKANKTTRSTSRSNKTRGNSRTSNIQTTNHSNYSQNKQGTRDYSMFKRRHQRTHHRDDLTWTDHQRHGRIGQATDNTRYEEGSSADEATECLHRSPHRHTDSGTTEEHHTKQMGPTQQRNRGASTHRGKRVYSSVLRLLLTLSLNNNWTVRTGDISVAFLHAAAATDDLHMYPPTESYNKADGIVWKLNKAIYGLRSSPKAWQTHLADVLQQLGLQRSTAEPNIYYTQQRSAYILVYVDDLLLLGDEPTVNKIFEAIQQHLLLRPTGTLTVGNTVSFLGRNITNRGDYYELGLADSYNNTLLEEAKMENCKPATAPGTSALKTPTADHDQPLSEDEHKAFRRAVGKLQWMTYTRPDICYATKELARALQQPTSSDQQKLKHLLRYIKGTTHYKQIIRPTVKLTQTSHDLNVYVDSDWAGCVETRKSTTGFSITFLGATIFYGSRTQATIALSSAEAELYAINTGATEALHFQNLLTDLLNTNKANIKIHTDSSSGKSIATRIGTGKKTKHVELKHLFIQQLVALNHLRIIKIHTNDNPADIFTKYVSADTLQRHLHSVGLHIQHYPHSSF